MATGRSIRIDEVMITLLEKMMEDFKNSQGVEISYTKASKILAERVINAGGVTF
jgi:hypothetical protein